MNFLQQRILMLERQLRTVGVLDASVLQAFACLAREDFVPFAYRDLAYADTIIPLSHQQALLSPGVSGQLLQALALKPTDQVLEIGTGSGYETAILAQLAQHVTTVELYDELLQAAKQRLEHVRVHNVTFVNADYALSGLDSQGYDAIFINGAVASIPLAVYDAVKPQGRLVVIMGQAPRMKACLVTRRAGVWQANCLFETVAPYLVSAPSAAFHF